MASVTKRIGKDGTISYMVRVFNGRRADGKQVFESETFIPTEKSPKRIQAELDAFVREFEMRVHEGKYIQGNKMTFDQFVLDWKSGWASKNLTMSSIEDYSYILEKRVAPNIGGLKIAKISPLHIQRIIDEESTNGMKIKTVKRTFTAINSVFKYAFQMQVISENPCQRVQLPKEKVNNMNTGYVEEIHYFDLEQANRFLHALSMEYVYTEKEHDCLWGKTGKVYHVKEREKKLTVSLQYQAFFTLALFSGFRRGEMLALVWDDINFDEETIRISKATANLKEGQVIKSPKTNAGYRTIRLPKQCFAILKKWKLEERADAFQMGEKWKGRKILDFGQQWVFIQKDGKQMNVSSPRQKFKDIITWYNRQCAPENRLPEIRLHDLRHTSATLLLASGIDIETVTKRMGHKHASTTLDVYGHALEAVDITASEKLGRLLAQEA